MFRDLIRAFDRHTLPMLYQCLSNLYRLAIRHDRSVAASHPTPPDLPDAERVQDQNAQEVDKSRYLQEAARTMMRAFNFCLNDRASMEVSRKWGAYYILSFLFKTYIKLGTLNLCRNSLRAIQVADLPPLDDFPKSHVVSYRFYVGVYHFWHEEYDKSREELLQAFQHCPRSHTRNKRLLHGSLPSLSLLKRFDLTKTYGPIARALKSGDLGLFHRTMESIEHVLTEQGTFLVVERCRMLCLRGLIKKVWLVSVGGTRLEVERVQRALSFCGWSVDLDEAECQCAILIAKGFMKGYLSHEKRVVVMSKTDPFPRLPAHLATIQFASTSF